MIKLLALLCLAAPAFGFLGFFPNWKTGFKATFGAFHNLPQTIEAAVKDKYEEKTRPESHEDFSSLVMLCPTTSTTCDYAVCLLFDDTGYIAGVQIGVNPDQVSENVYDWKVQGFTRWETNNNGVNETYWTIQIYFSSPEYLKRPAADRIAKRDSKKLLQDDFIYVTSINGELHAISTNVLDIADTAKSNFTEQACMIGMGHHYYYQMTKDLPCNNHLFKFFPLVYADRFIGLGTVVLYGKHTVKKGCTNYFEDPGELAVKMIVPRGPQCLYDLAGSPGLVTMHLYFYDNISDLLCLQ